MADIRATKNGNWSDATVWTPNPPAAGDVVRPNNFTVTIDISVTVTEIRNDAGGGAVAGGSFTLNNGVTVTASNGFFGTYLGAGIGLLNYGGTGTVTLNGNIDGSRSSVTDTCAVSNNSSGTIIINGNLTSAGSGSSSQTVRNQSTGTFIITGNLTSIGGILIRNNAGTTTINGNITTNSATAIQNTSGTVTITGNCSSNASATSVCITNASGTVTVIGDLFIQVGIVGQNHRNIVNSGAGTVNIVGTVNGGGNSSSGLSYCILNSSNGTINVTGTVNGITNAVTSILQSTILNNGGGNINVTGTVNSGIITNTIFSATIYNSSGTVTINGNCQSAGAGIAITNLVATVSINGNAIGGASVVTIYNSSTGTITVNGNAIGGTGWFAIEGVNAAGNTIIERAVYSNLGQSPITGFIKFKTGTPEIDVLREDSVIVTLRDPLNVSGLLPTTSDVRSGTTYNSGSSTGTLAMPAVNLVQLGVPVNNTVGTANLTPADFWDYLISNGFIAGSIGERLKNASTVDTTGAQIAGFII